MLWGERLRTDCSNWYSLRTVKLALILHLEFKITSLSNQEPSGVRSAWAAYVLWLYRMR